MSKINRCLVISGFACIAAGALSFAGIHLPVVDFGQDTRPRTATTRTITIRAVPGMQYDTVRFHVEPGAGVRLVFINTDDMDHNLLITRPGSREQVVDAALKLGEKGLEKDFIPEVPEVLHALNLLSPGEKQAITFTAPEKKGVYPYVCTYPGHGQVMYGAMYVGLEPPPLKKDAYVPPARRTVEARKITQLHPYEAKPPYLYRIFMPDSGPASIAVSLPGQVSYCWDAGSCRLRYAWYGGFVDNSVPWSIKGDATAKITGEVFYRERGAEVLHFGKVTTEGGNAAEKSQASSNGIQADFKGYRLVQGGYPEFHYILDGKEVYELIKPLEDGPGLVRSFRIPGVGRPLRFSYTPQKGIEAASDKGTWKDSTLYLSAEEATAFSVSIKRLQE